MKSSMFAMSLRVAHDAKPAEVRKRCLRMHGTTLAARGHDRLRHDAGEVVPAPAQTVTTTVSVGTNPGRGPQPVTNKIYVVNYSSNNVTVIDGRGRDDSHESPPAQNRTCAFHAYGSHLGWVTSKR